MNQFDAYRVALQLVKHGITSHHAARLEALKPATRGTYPLTTPRLELRPWNPEDRAAYIRTLSMSGHPGPNEAEALAQMRQDMASFGQYGFGRLAVVDKTSSDRPVIGRAGFKLTNPLVFARTFLEIGWYVMPEFHGRGIASEAAKALVDQGRRLGLGVVGVYFHPENDASKRVAAKIGASPVGRIEGMKGPLEYWALDCGREPTLAPVERAHGFHGSLHGRRESHGSGRQRPSPRVPPGRRPPTRPEVQ